jgi:hypothetical protein
MSSEQLADGVNPLDAELAATWDVLKGYSGRDTDLGIARRFGGSAAAYSLRDIGAMNGRVVKARRDVGETSDPEEDFSANQVQSGTLEDWVNGKLESTLPADVDTAAATYSLRKAKASYSGDAVRIRRSSDNVEVDVALDSDGKVSTSSTITNVAEQGGESGSTNATTLGDFISYRDNIIGNSEFNTVANLGFNDGGTAAPLWNKAGGSAGSATFTSNTTETTDPNGGNTAAKYEWGTSSGAGTNWLRQETELAGGVEVTFSAYYKQLGSQTTVRHNYWKGTSDINVVLDFSNGTISEAPSGGSAPTSSAVENVGNGWYRVSMVLTTVAATVENKAQPARQPAGVTGEGVYVWGAMLEVGNTLGTYVKTTSEIPNGVAFVHTWYDQAGSNDAVQETDANQPKIAENGALLADGLFFDGVNDSFEVTDITNVNFPATVVSVSETNSTGINRALYSLNNDTNACGGFYRSTNKYAINNGTTTLAGSATYTTGVHRLKFDLFNGASSAGFSNSVSDISGDIGTEVSQVTHFRIAGSLKTGITTPHSGTIKEIILYTSDQSANRFKIESNINNYYGLYNDANDLSAAFDSNGTIDNASKDGFTADVATFSHYVNATFNNSVATGETIYVSFNAQLAPNGGTSASPILRLQDAQVGSNTSNQSSISEGFNSIDLTATGTSDRVGFLEQDDNVDYIISNFKVSRIARNGFVETWYDQSGNGNDATQESASQQPAIVQNGGITTSNGSPSVRFDGSNDELDFTDLTLTDATVFNVINFDISKSSGIVLGGSAAAGSGGAMIPFMLNSSSTSVYVNASVGSQFVNGASTTFGTRLEARTALRTGSQLLYTIVDLDVAEADTIDGIGRTPSDQTTHHPLAHYNEVIIYNSDLSSDRGTIESEIANHYNITLS